MYKLNEIDACQPDKNEMNQQLRELYLTYWDNYQHHIKSQFDAANPYLITVPDRYVAATPKIMICGQETQGWGGEFDHHPEMATIDNLMKLYQRFVNLDGGSSSPYWHFIRKLKESAPEIGFVCNNVVKIGRHYSPGCDDRINNLTLAHFNILCREIDILKPNLLIFLTGPRYDLRIKSGLGEFKITPIEGYPLNALAKIDFKEPSLPTAFRCYHPGYLRRIGLENRVFANLVSYCKS